jgi:hypothetical protein
MAETAGSDLPRPVIVLSAGAFTVDDMDPASFNILLSRWHLAVEVLLVTLLVGTALLWANPKAGGALTRLENAIVRFSQRPWLTAFLVGSLAIGLRAALLPVLGPPVPYVADEFSILLQAQTFALGTLAMPTHPLHPFFESYYVNQVPAYASMYFPGRGAPLAAGIALFGSAWAGVWLSMIALCMCVPWMLRAWVSKPLALIGGVLVVLEYAVLSGWINSYYGGAFTALGGVLVLGAFPRLLQEPRWRDGAALGLGLFILMISRPFEGALFALPFGLVLLVSVVRRLSARELTPAIRIGLPTVGALGAGALLILVSNAATTGNMLADPYSLNRASHAVAPPFLFQELGNPSNRLPANMVRGYQAEAESHVMGDSIGSFAIKAVSTIRRAIEFYAGALFIIPLVIGLFLMRKHYAVLASGALLSLSVIVNTWEWSHYWAPGFGLFIILIMKGFGGLRRWRFRSREAGLFLSRALPIATAAMLVIPMIALYAGAPRTEPVHFFRTCCIVVSQTNRNRIIEQLRASPRRDLVLVRHRSDEQPFMTLVANEPDIDGSEIVWAHDRGGATQQLLAYYPDRNVWRVNGIADKRATLQRPALRSAR